MSNDNSFDDLIRKRLASSEEEVNPLAWDTIEKELPQQAKRVAFFRRRYLLLLLLLVPATGYFMWQQNSKVELPLVNERSENAKVNSTTYTGSDSPNDLPAASSKKNDVASELANRASSVNTVGIGIVQTNDFSKTTKNSKAVKLSDNNTNVSNGNAVNNTKETTDVNTPAQSEGTTISHIDPINSYTEILPADPIGVQLLNLPGSEMALLKGGVVNNQVLLPAEKEQKIPGLFAEAFYSPDFSSKKMSMNSADESYLRLRKNTETYFYSHSMGLRVGYAVNKNISVKVGYDYTVVQERLSYSYIPSPEEAARQGLQVDTISGTLIDALTNTATDTIIGNYEAIGEATVSNFYKYYNLPLIVNYTFGKNKIKWVTGAGTFLNVGLKTTGSIINTDRVTRINLAEKSRSPYRASVGMGISAELLMSYGLTKNVTFLVGPHAKYYFSNINKKSAPLNEKFFNWGIYTGFRVTF